MSGKRIRTAGRISKLTKWQAEMEALRTLVSSCGLHEAIKWGWPCYSVEGKNIVLLHAFKDYFAILFFKGALVADPKKILVQQTENVQAARQMRFISLAEVKKNNSVIKAYVAKAVQVELSGKKVQLKQTNEFSVPAEFAAILKEDAKVKSAFETLTPGRQRAYLLHFSAAKQSTTREARIKKYLPKILAGKGIND